MRFYIYIIYIYSPADLSMSLSKSDFGKALSLIWKRSTKLL